MTSNVPQAQRRKWANAALFALILLGFGLRLYRIDFQSIWRDEADSLFFAGSWANLASMWRAPGHNALLYYTFLHLWQGFAGTGLFAARFFSALWGTLALSLALALGRRLMPRPAAAFSLVLLVGAPYLIWYSQEARGYAMLLTLTLLATGLYLRAVETSRIAFWAGYLLCMAAAVYTHFFAAMLIPAHLLMGLLQHPQGRRAWATWGVCMALLILPAIPLLRWGIPLLRSSFQTGHAPVGPGEMLAGPLLAFTLGPSGLLSPWWVFPFLFIVLIGLVGGMLGWAGAPTRRSLGLILLWVGIPFLGALLLAMWGKDIFSERYLIYLVPPLYYLAGAGLGMLRQIHRPLAGAVFALLLLVQGMGVAVQTSHIIKPDFRAAAAVLEERAEPGDLVLFLIPQAQRPLAYYTPAPAGVTYAGAPYANDAGVEEAVEAEMTRLVGSRQRVWLLESEAELWDAVGRAAQWLAGRGRLEEDYAFHRVRLRLYTLIREAPAQ